MPVPPPTQPSSTGPDAAAPIAAAACRDFTAVPWMSLRWPSQVSVTTGSSHSGAMPRQLARTHSTTPRCTGPTAYVLVMTTGTASEPLSSIHAVPVISPLPLNECQPAAQGVPTPSRPRGNSAVTPVRTSSPSTRVT